MALVPNSLIQLTPERLMTQDVGSMIAQAREDQLAKAKAESRALRMNFAKYLVPAYLADRVGIATLCDTELDPTGNLLGYLRQAAKDAETHSN